ncbi:MAG TPA: flagellar hook-basal body complex protein FliE [Bryobacteraceae bacterium]|jgi:flagellar hook-basal body complex protein FliE|nr:flagellar hook-basal body complex protein FliE [Bryobacteraceae bacterium]
MTTSSISGIAPIASAPSSLGGESSQPGAFQSVLEGTIGTLESLNKDAGTAVQSFLSGQNEDLHTTILATQQAEMAFQLGLQVRNKMVSAYQEIMKMQL